MSSTDATVRAIMGRPVSDSFTRVMAAFTILVSVMSVFAFVIYSQPGGRIPVLVGLVIYGIGLGVAHMLTMTGADALDRQRWRRFRSGGTIGAFLAFFAGMFLAPDTYMINENAPLPMLAAIRVGLPAAAGALAGYVNLMIHDNRDKEQVVAALQAATAS